MDSSYEENARARAMEEDGSGAGEGDETFDE